MMDFFGNETLAQDKKKRNGSNRLLLEDRPAHDWYRFVLSYPPHLVADYIGRFNLDSRHTVLDPFCGTGTTLVESEKRGIASVGIEANPMAHFAAKVKLSWGIDPDDLLRHAYGIAEAARSELADEGIIEGQVFAASTSDVRPGLALRGFSQEAQDILLA